MEDIKVTEGEIGLVGVKSNDPYLSFGEFKKRQDIKWAKELGRVKENNIKCYLCGIPSGAKRADKGVSLRKTDKGYICQWCWK